MFRVKVAIALDFCPVSTKLVAIIPASSSSIVLQILTSLAEGFFVVALIPLSAYLKKVNKASLIRGCNCFASLLSRTSSKEGSPKGFLLSLELSNSGSGGKGISFTSIPFFLLVFILPSSFPLSVLSFPDEEE